MLGQNTRQLGNYIEIENQLRIEQTFSPLVQNIQICGNNTFIHLFN